MRVIMMHQSVSEDTVSQPTIHQRPGGTRGKEKKGIQLDWTELVVQPNQQQTQNTDCARLEHEYFNQSPCRWWSG